MNDILTPERVYRKYVTDGVLESGVHDPEKAEIIQLLDTLFGVANGSWYVLKTKVALESVTPENETDGGVVLDDPDPANNGYYSRSAGQWFWRRGFPDTLGKLTVTGGTPDQVQASVETGVNPASVKAFYIDIATPNTGPVTISISGAAYIPAYNINGVDFAAGEWSGRLLLANDITSLRAMVDAAAAQSAAASAAEAEGFRDEAEAFKNAAEAAAGAVVSPGDFGAASGNTPAANQAAFAAFEAVLSGSIVDLREVTYPVETVPTGNIYKNCRWKITNADGDATVLYPARETYKTYRSQLAWTPLYTSWPQGKGAVWADVLYVGYNQGPDHSTSGEHEVYQVRSYDGGQTWFPPECIFPGHVNVEMSFSAGFTDGQHWYVVRESTPGTGAITGEKLYSRRAYEIRELTAHFETTIGFPNITVTMPGHGLRDGQRASVFFAVNGLGGVAVTGTTQLVVANCTAATFDIVGNNNASSSVSTDLAGGIRFLENEVFDEVLVDGVSFGQAIINASGGAIASVPGEVHGFCAGPAGSFYVCIDSGDFVYLCRVDDIYGASPTIGFIRVISSVAARAEGTVYYDPATGDVGGFLRTQDSANFPMAFWYSQDECATAPTITAGPANFGERSPIGVKLMDGVLYATLSGKRFRDSTPGNVGIYWMRATLADAAANGFGAFTPTLEEVDNAYYSDSGQTGVGVSDIIAYKNRVTIAYCSEHPLVINDFDGNPNPYALTIDLSTDAETIPGDSRIPVPTAFVAPYDGFYTNGLSADDNLLLNGSLRFWELGQSQSVDGVKSANHVALMLGSATGALTRGTFTTGQQDVPGNPRYYADVETTVASNNSGMGWLIEDVRTCAGDYVTFDLWVWSETRTLNLDLGVQQVFGTGGSPSAITTTPKDLVVPPQKWVRRTVSMKLPSIFGKTVGSNEDSYLRAYIRSTVNELVHFRVAMAGLWPGQQAPRLYPERTIADERAMLWRYFQKVGLGIDGWAAAADSLRISATFPRMRSDPAVTLLTSTPPFIVLNSAVSGAGSALTLSNVSPTGLRGSINGFSGLTIGNPATSDADSLLSLNCDFE